MSVLRPTIDAVQLASGRGKGHDGSSPTTASNLRRSPAAANSRPEDITRRGPLACFATSGLTFGGALMASVRKSPAAAALISCGFALLFASAGATAAPVYRLIDLGDLAGLGAAALDLNESGQATGTSPVGVNTANAFLYSHGSMTDLGAPQPFERSQGNGINDYGVAVGTVLNYQGDVARAAIFTGTSVEVLGTFGGSTSLANGINNSGQVTGSARTADGNFHAFVYSNGAMADLGALYGQSSTGHDINEAGQVAGTFLSGANGMGGFLFDGASMIDLSTQGARSAAGINNQGTVTGQTYGNLAYLYQGGILTTLGTLGGSRSAGVEVNDRGQVVGGANITGDAAQHAFLFSEGEMYDLNNLLAPGESLGWTLTVAYSINERGQIAGAGLMNGAQRAFILDPLSVPEPTTLALVGVALFGFAATRRRKLKAPTA